jgi:TolB protein
VVRALALSSCAAVLVTVASASAAAPRTNGRIVFERLDPSLGKTRLYTVRPDGGDLRALTKPAADDGQESHADWAPSGRAIVFRRIIDVGQPNERADLFVVNADGTHARDLTRSSCRLPCLTNDEPAWSPDAKRIAFVRSVGPLPPSGGPAPVVGIFVMNADGTNVRQLTQRVRNTGTEDHAPTWSPDGKRIAFVRTNNTARPANASVIYVMNANGSRARTVRVMPHRWPGSGAPSWSPDGKKILYSTSCWFGDCGQPRTGAQLFTIGVDGKARRQLTHVSGNAEGGRWSPDGRKIVFVRSPRVGPSGDVYTANANGTGLRRVTRSLALGTRNPDWGPLTR